MEHGCNGSGGGHCGCASPASAGYDEQALPAGAAPASLAGALEMDGGMEQGCCGGSGGGQCGCASPQAAGDDEQGLLDKLPKVPEFVAVGAAGAVVASINGQALHAPDRRPPERELRQLACTELLRQAAQRQGLLAGEDRLGDGPGEEGVISEAATGAIEQLLEQVLNVPEPGEPDCQRYFDAHAAQFAQGERVRLRHVLFAVTPGIEVRALAQRAEALLMELRCADDDGLRFAEAARQWSNCPSGQEGGDLGWLGRADCAPEFARDVFGSQEVGVLPRLVRSRFGLHVVEVCEREAGQVPAWPSVRPAVVQTLRQQTWIRALNQYVQLLAGQARIVGVQLDAAASPLVQ